MTSGEHGEMVTTLTEDSQLRELAKILLNREEQDMADLNSELERAKYFKDCNDAYDKTISLLDNCSDINQQKSTRQASKNSKDDEDDAKEIPDNLKDAMRLSMLCVEYVINMSKRYVRKSCLPKSWVSKIEKHLDSLVLELEYECKDIVGKLSSLFPSNKKSNCLISFNHDIIKTNDQQVSKVVAKVDIAKDIQDYIRYAISMSMECIREGSLRMRWISTLETHFETLVQELEDLDIQNNQTNARFMVRDVCSYKQSMCEYADNHRSSSARAKSMEYAGWLRQEETSFQSLLKGKKTELEFVGEFDSFTELQQLEVYHGIINDSRRANISELKEDLANKPAWVSVVLLNASLMVWDIYEQAQATGNAERSHDDILYWHSLWDKGAKTLMTH